MSEISIIVPVYNVEKYLENCIESILNQTFKDFELILVDDGSTDNSGKICDIYEKKDSRIKVIHKNNGGLSSARNAGLDIACGKYVGFIDSDDSIHPRMYEILYDLIKKYESDISCCNYKKIYDIFKDEIKLSGKRAVVAVVATIGLFAIHWGDVAAIYCFPYLFSVVMFAEKQISEKIASLGNYSYAIYLVAFPIQQILVSCFSGMNPFVNTLYASICSILCGILIYHFCKKALKYF